MTLPTVGGSAGTHGTVLNAHINVGHDADGTHKKSQMLTDMGYSPTAYAGGETATFPNGMILKHGEESVAADTTDTVTFGTAFPTAIISITVTYKVSDNNISEVATAEPVALTGVKITNGDDSVQTIYWRVWGY